MKKSFLTAAAILSMSAALPSVASAGTVFSDNFNSYSYMLDWNPPANWSVPGPGTVDLIGVGTVFDLQPGNGSYIDLDGSNQIAGTLQTLASFAAGTYTLTFDLAGNQRNDLNKTTDISLGNFNTSLTLSSDAAFTTHSYTFTTTGGMLAFTDLNGGNNNIGNLLDNVTLSSAVPEPSSWALMLAGFGLVGLAIRNRRKTVNYAFD